MAVLSFQSADGKVAIKASTAADTANCWRRFSARVGENASRYCSYRSSLAGRLAIALPSQSHRLTDAGEEAAMQWDNLPPVFYETAVYNVNIYLSDIESEPRVVHKLKEVSDLFTAISVGDNKWVLTAPLSFLNAYDFRRDCEQLLETCTLKPRLLVGECTGIVETFLIGIGFSIVEGFQ